MSYAVKLASVVALAALVAAPTQGFAAGGGKGKRRPDADKPQSAQKLTKAREEAYQNALKGIPDGKPNNDPWAGAR